MSSTADKARRAALGLIARQPYTAHRLRAKLRGRKFEAEVIDALLEQLMEAGIVDDARYAQEFAAYHAGDRGPRRIAADLRARGVARHHVDAALAGLEEGAEGDAAVAVLERMRSRYAGLEPPVARRRAYAMLARRGFSVEAARRAMTRVLTGVDPDDD